MSTETVGLLGTGAEDGHLDFHTTPGLCGDPLNAPAFCSQIPVLRPRAGCEVPQRDRTMIAATSLRSSKICQPEAGTK